MFILGLLANMLVPLVHIIMVLLAYGTPNSKWCLEHMALSCQARLSGIKRGIWLADDERVGAWAVEDKHK